MTDGSLEGPRVEIKFATAVGNYGAILKWMHLSTVSVERAFPPRRVNNLYFDGLAFESLRTHLSGLAERTKLRYRWYGPEPGIHPGGLEIKLRRNRAGWKRRFEISTLNWVPHSPWQHITRQIADQVPAQARLWLASRPAPVVINSFDRDYYACTGGRVRVTIDRHLTAWDQRSAAGPDWTRRLQPRDEVIVELKVAPAALDEALDIARRLRLRPHPYSKYLSFFGLRASVD